MREILVTNPSMIGTAIKDPNTINGIASGAALDKETASMPHSLGTDDTEDSQHLRAERTSFLTSEAISDARKAHAAERSIAAAQPEHPGIPQNVDVTTGGATPTPENTQPVRPAPTHLDGPLATDDI
jgi:hypothetical protein